MGADFSVREVVQVVLLCILWYTVSSSNGVIGKTLLTDFPYPMTVTMVQLTSISLYSGPIFALAGIRSQAEISSTCYWKFIVPLAFGKFISSVLSHISIWKVPVSYSHTVKATMPLFVVILSRLVLGEKQTLKVYLSLIPIIIGVFIASMTEISFHIVGLVCALLATFGFSLQNIYSKKVLHDTSIHHLRLLYLLARLALLFFTPIWIVFDLRKMFHDNLLMQNTNVVSVIFLLFLDGLLNFFQNVIAFSVLSLVSPLTYAVCNASKRIAVISVSLIMLQNPVTATNFFGMVLAIFGVFCYNKAKYDSIQDQKQLFQLPYKQQDGNLLLKPHDRSHLHYNPVITNGQTNHNASIHLQPV